MNKKVKKPGKGWIVVACVFLYLFFMLWLHWFDYGRDDFPALAFFALVCLFIYCRKMNKYLEYIEKQQNEKR